MVQPTPERPSQATPPAPTARRALNVSSVPPEMNEPRAPAEGPCRGRPSPLWGCDKPLSDSPKHHRPVALVLLDTALGKQDVGMAEHLGEGEERLRHGDVSPERLRD